MRNAAALALLLLGLAPEEESDRSPAGLALSPDGRWALTANATRHSVSLVDLEAGRVAAEIPVGRLPRALALSRDGRRAVVSNGHSDSLTLIDAAPPALKPVATFPVGDDPRGVAISPDGARAYVALSGEDAAVSVDLAAGRVVGRVEVGQEPWHLALSPDGRRLAVGAAGSGEVAVVETEPFRLVRRVPVRGRNLRRLAVSPDGAWAYVVHIADGGASTVLRDIETGRVIMNRLSRVPLAGDGPAESLALDPSGFALGDPEAVAARPDGGQLALVAGGVRAVVLLTGLLPFAAQPGPFIDPRLHKDPARYKRNVLRGRPVDVAYLPDGKHVVVANYLRNQVQVVEAAAGEIVKEIPLGGPATPSLARKGEAIFYDAYRSWHEWFSCNTCHAEGHTNGGSYDTFNDGKYGNPKKVLSLRGVSKTPPWTWHGRQKDLRQSLQGSFTRTMAREPASREDLEAFVAFLQTLDFDPPPPARDPEAAKRGEAVFRAKACDACHAPPYFTNDEAVLTGLESPDDAFKGFNPPPLRGVGRRAPYLHDGRARTLEEVLQKHHRPLKLTGKEDPTPEELRDLVAFLRSL
jgi:DNA-binding beta-propeller fold protein YncE